MSLNLEPKRHTHSASTVLAFVLTSFSATAQTEVWTLQLGTPANESPTAIVPDGAGGAFLCGTSEGDLGGPNSGAGDPWLARHDVSGAQLWAVQFGTGAHEALVCATADEAGGVYVGGWTQGGLGGPSAGGSDAWVARYDGAGNQLWLRQLGTGAADSVIGLDADGPGLVHLVGTTSGSFTGAGSGACFVARYDSAGHQASLRQFDLYNPSLTVDEYPTSVAAGAAGGAYVGGTIWMRFGTPGCGSFLCVLDIPSAVVAHVDGAGNVTQISQQSAARDPELSPDGLGGFYLLATVFGGGLYLQRSSGVGAALWSVTMATFGQWMEGISPDGADGVYVCGATNGFFPGPNAGGDDAWFGRFDGGGTLLWTLRLGTSASDSACAIASSGTNDVYVSGVTSGSIGGPHAGLSDTWVARLYDDSSVTTYCSSQANSTGVPGTLDAIDIDLNARSMRLMGRDLPPGVAAYSLCSLAQGHVVSPGGSSGNLCLGGSIGRRVGGASLTASAAGTLLEDVDLDRFPLASGGTVAAQAGATWHFQLWYRDTLPGVGIPTSNFTNGVRVQF